ncbi:MAG: hypothetical protein JW880_01625 [Candidatus Thermoplasmatota archaeon]|nr:hypothetical protein [Candidatus Thermoplasmatota archaeon]
MVDLSPLAEEPVPAIALVVGGLLSIAIALYGQREDSYWDEVGTVFAFVLGAGMLVMAFIAGTEEAVGWFTLAIIIILALTLFLKPMREIPWSGVVGALVGGAAALIASYLLPSELFGVDEWVFLVVIFIIVGAIVHSLVHFLEDLFAIATMVLQWKPTMIIIGLLSLAEGALVLTDHSIGSFL